MTQLHDAVRRLFRTEADSTAHAEAYAHLRKVCDSVTRELETGSDYEYSVIERIALLARDEANKELLNTEDPTCLPRATTAYLTVFAEHVLALHREMEAEKLRSFVTGTTAQHLDRAIAIIKERL